MRLTKIFWICFPISFFCFLFLIPWCLFSHDTTWHRHCANSMWHLGSNIIITQDDLEGPLVENLKTSQKVSTLQRLYRTSECVLWTFDANSAGCWLKSQIVSEPVPVREDSPHQNGWIFDKSSKKGGGNFSENSSVLVGEVFPYRHRDWHLALQPATSRIGVKSPQYALRGPDQVWSINV